MKNITLFSGNSNKQLACDICKSLNNAMGVCDLSSFQDGEIKIKIGESVRDKCVFIIQSVTSTDTMSINDVLMELYLLIRTIKRASAKKVIAIVPYYGYCRQDRKTTARAPISASDVAMMLETAGADRVVSIELHCGQIQGFFRNIPCDNLYASCTLAKEFIKQNTELCKERELIVVSPDAGGVTRAKQFKDTLSQLGFNSGFAVIVKERNIEGAINNMSLVGNVKDCDVVIVDDICDTGGTLIKAVNQLIEFGAKNIYVCIAHGVFSNNALDLIENSHIKKMYVTDTISMKKKIHNVIQISVSELLKDVINIFIHGGSVNDLFICKE